MAAQIPAHVSVAYPKKVPDLANLHARVGAAVRTAAPFELELGAVVHDGDPGNGVFVRARAPSIRLRSTAPAPGLQVDAIWVGGAAWR